MNMENLENQPKSQLEREISLASEALKDGDDGYLTGTSERKDAAAFAVSTVELADGFHGKFWNQRLVVTKSLHPYLEDHPK